MTLRYLSAPLLGRLVLLLVGVGFLAQGGAARAEDMDVSLPPAFAKAVPEGAKDLRAIGGERKINIVYALQPEIVMEDPADLTAKEKTIQQIAFEHHRNLGTLSWRYLTTKIAGILATFESDEFEFVDLVTVARKNTDDKYTDYCHLTSQGNRLVAEKLYPAVHRLLGL